MTKQTPMPTLYYPIPNTVSSKDFELISKEFNIIPYFGISEFQSHGILQTLFDLSQYSPTKAAVTNGIIDYAFGGSIKFVGRTFEGIDTTDVIDNTVQISEIAQIVEVLTRAGLSAPQIIAISRQLELHLNVCGNAYLHYKEVTVLGVTKIYLSVIHPLKAAIKQDLFNTSLVVTDKWDKKYWSKFPPQNIALYPEFSSSERSVKETVFHLKTVKDDSDYYGRPNLSSMYWQFIEANMAMKVNKISSQDFVAAYMLLVEAMPPGDGNEDISKQNAANLLMQLATIKGGGEKAKSIIVSEYAHGGQKPELLSFDLVRDSAYEAHVMATAESEIIKSENYQAELVGGSRTKSSIGGDKTIIYKMLTVNEMLIKPKQDKMSDFWSVIFANVSNAINDDTLNKYQVKFSDKIDGLVKSMTAINQTQNNGTIPNDTTTV